VVDLIENPGLVVIYSVVLDCIVNHFLFQSVDDFNLVELNHHSALSSTRDVAHSVGLDSNLD